MQETEKFKRFVLNRRVRDIQSWEGDSLTPNASITWATNDAWHTFLDWARDREASTIFAVKENVEKTRE